MKISKFFILLLLITIFSCNDIKKNGTNNDQILAKVGNEVITVEEFRNNYEMGFGNLKSGENPKKSYLNYMINEKILALEGYRLGFDKLKSIKKSVNALLKDLLIEALLQQEVKDKIKVSDEEIKDAINKSKVSFKFRYWFEPSYDRAKKVSQAMKLKGYADVVDEILLENPEYSIDPKLLETDYLNYMQISPDLLIAIKDLPYGEVSDPVELNDKYYIFQVLDIRRSSVTENEYMSKAHTFEKIVFYRKFEKALGIYGSQLLDPKQIKTKAKAFNIVVEALLEWREINPTERYGFREHIQNADQNQKALNKLRENIDNAFFEYNDGSFSIKKFLEIFKSKRFLKDFGNKQEFIQFMHSEVSRTIRDYFLLKEAEGKDIIHHPIIQKELSMWRDKWVYAETRNNIVKDVVVDENFIKEYFENNREKYKTTENEYQELSKIYKQVKRDAFQYKIHSTIDSSINSLKDKFKVEINEAVLDTIKIVEFKKSKWATMQVLKYGTSKPALPVVDPNWAIYK